MNYSCLCIIGEGSYVSIQNIHENPGLLIERVGTTLSSHSNWKTIQRIDMTDLLNGPKNLLNMYVPLTHLCNYTCASADILKQAQLHWHAAIRMTHDLLLTIDPQQGHMRKKRSLVPVLGRVANLLFDTLDDLAEERIQSWIETSANDTRALAALLANQTEKQMKNIQYDTYELVLEAKLIIDIVIIMKKYEV
uniref:Uncharacterized protein n=1 Tax=Trichogramma kaykai TaxID=54128 RepID=A0ABD2WAH5_9HYME